MNKEQKEIYMKLVEKKLDQHPILDVKIPIVGWFELILFAMVLFAFCNDPVEYRRDFILTSTVLILTWAEPFVLYFIDKARKKKQDATKSKSGRVLNKKDK